MAGTVPPTRIILTEEEVPSFAYAEWVEKRVGDVAAGLERRVRETAEQNRLAILREPAKTAEIMKKGTALVENSTFLVDDYRHHCTCLRSAREGKFCHIDDIQRDKTTHETFVWLPLKARKSAAAADEADAGDVAAAAGVDAEGAVGETAGADERERWLSGEALENWHRNDENRNRALPRHDPDVLVRDGFRWLGPGYAHLSGSIAQDQLRMWMAVVRRRWETEAQLPNFPKELFLIVRRFLRPVGSVILNPMYLAVVTERKRTSDLEHLLTAGLAHCLQAAHSLGTTNEKEVAGAVSWSKDATEVRALGNTIVTVMLANKFFSVEGPNMWPTRTEEQITSSRAWNELRQQEITARDPFVRLSKNEAKYDNIMSVLRTFFEAKGLNFTQNEEEREKFTISWA